ncbi:Protein VACUOLELESS GAMETOPHYTES [Cardamine amara subsp. amara]|uniref:Protein VACUOLELESS GAMETOPHYTES n=1 Tax=Cardamine amara subsp. amara TaxID=228776 RepID=A0ABD1BPT4_CARAN
MDSEKKLVSICPRVEAVVELREGKFHLVMKIHGDPKEKKCEADTKNFIKFFQVEETIYVYCKLCYGNGHEESYKKSPPIKHYLHPKHTLMFVGCENDVSTRKCLCCQDPLKYMFYCCPSCDFPINLACVDKKTLFSIEHPKRHEHTLTLFPRQVSINCNVCALDDSRSPIYICPGCDFVVHKRCIDLPWLIRISRHPHRISFTSSFALGDWFCNICRRKINNDYGGYICNKEGCSYFAHSRCTTGENVWDGQELEGEPEEVEEEEVEPFVRLRDGIIRHFSHEHRHLKLDEDSTDRVYDEYRSCKACIMPIYYGNFYSCLDCGFILHETCANLSRRIYHAIHPHPLVLRMESPYLFSCSACSKVCSGFFYECSRRECSFTLHVQCATIYEPLIHKSHVHPLFLTSEPGECRSCSICNDSGIGYGSDETFNCIECNFSLCFKCASLPQKVRYKHDEHILTLSYGEETSETNHNWCEMCETRIKPGKRFYTCEDCCVTLHIKCLLGRDMHSRFGSYSSGPGKIDILPNNRMTRPICSSCHKRCNQKMVFQRYGLKHCCFSCLPISTP